jgi:ACS family pantothenate transporter-like MFS transporter
MAMETITKGQPAYPDSDGSEQKTAPAVDITPIDEISPRDERAFLWRLDLGFLTVGFLGYMFKYIDQTNIVRPSPSHSWHIFGLMASTRATRMCLE